MQIWIGAEVRNIAARIEFVFVNLKTGGVSYIGEYMPYTLQVDKKVTALIAPVDMYGNPARVDGKPTWSLSDPALADLTVAPDGLSVVLNPVGSLGAVQLKVSADADLGAGVKTVAGLVDIDLVAGDAIGLSISIGAAEPK